MISFLQFYVLILIFVYKKFNQINLIKQPNIRHPLLIIGDYAFITAFVLQKRGYNPIVVSTSSSNFPLFTTINLSKIRYFNSNENSELHSYDISNTPVIQSNFIDFSSQKSILTTQGKLYFDKCICTSLRNNNDGYILSIEYMKYISFEEFHYEVKEFFDFTKMNFGYRLFSDSNKKQVRTDYIKKDNMILKVKSKVNKLISDNNVQMGLTMSRMNVERKENKNGIVYVGPYFSQTNIEPIECCIRDSAFLDF